MNVNKILSIIQVATGIGVMLFSVAALSGVIPPQFHPQNIPIFNLSDLELWQLFTAPLGLVGVAMFAFGIFNYWSLTDQTNGVQK